MCEACVLGKGFVTGCDSDCKRNGGYAFPGSNSLREDDIS
jgi:hypothetical protein